MYKDMINKRVIVRSDEAGLFYGTLESVEDNGYSVMLTNVRKLWYWDGAAAPEGIAIHGVTKPENCKFTCYVERIGVNGVCQTLLCSEEACKSIEAVPEWRA